ncbi:MAG: RluA family pseudouridine synthase [Candidatus Pacebacteria bacterium]|nr:RluA family pseudouridine synthase [Candidatus Paceibacterota bacterium]
MTDKDKKNISNGIKIIYEDENILAINKPSGLVVHSDGKTKEATLADWVLKNYPETEDVGEPLVLSTGEIIKRPGIVHRLDRETSGILLIAKNQKTFLFLKEQFQKRTIKKSYRAFVYGEMKNDDGIIDRPIGRSNKDFRMWSAQRGARGQMRTAVTEYNVLERSNGFSFVEVNPKTGRTHQIRVHFKAINHPIVSDSLYAPKREKGLGFDRLALHSYSIEFSLPNGKEMKLEAELPEDFLRALKNLNISIRG